MNNNTIRPVPLIITGVALIALAALLIHARHQAAPATVATTPAANPQSLCYILNKPTASGHNDIAYLKLTSTDGGAHTTGELGIALAEKDAMKGTLIGTVTPNADQTNALFDGQYINTGEGMSNVNEQMIQLGNDKASIGYGDTVQNADGSYRYKDKSAVTYSLDIPLVDCAKYDSLKTASN